MGCHMEDLGSVQLFESGFGRLLAPKTFNVGTRMIARSWPYQEAERIPLQNHGSSPGDGFGLRNESLSSLTKSTSAIIVPGYRLKTQLAGAANRVELR